MKVKVSLDSHPDSSITEELEVLAAIGDFILYRNSEWDEEMEVFASHFHEGDLSYACCYASFSSYDRLECFACKEVGPDEFVVIIKMLMRKL